ncbi:hypothetical protein ACJMK2_044170 [Sinanodonta woodiana]|uniref:Ig-like domain-containing protein n=1 Tax=Sinanodonta woodiana TaxID=1069815 RepID=A0ABD3W2I4_SINWO
MFKLTCGKKSRKMKWLHLSLEFSHWFMIMFILIETVTCYIVKRYGPPRFLQTPVNITVSKGELAVLGCHIQNLGPKMKVVWRDTSKDFPLTIGTMTFAPEDEMSVDYKYISRTESHWDLTIKNVKPHHAGLYECQISSSTLFTHYVRLNVIDEPETSVKISAVRVTGDEYVTLHEKIHLTCNATGADHAPDDVDWFFEGNRIHTSSPRWRDRVEVLKRRPIPGKAYISDLIIRRSTMADQGSYVCRSSDLSVNSIKVHVLNGKLS